MDGNRYILSTTQRYNVIGVAEMWVEIFKPVALMLCMLSLYAVFHTAFLIPASDLHQKISDSLELLALSGAISLLSGLLFYRSEPERVLRSVRFSAMLPVRVFFLTAGAMLILFIISWYLESHCIFYRDIRPLR